MLEKASFFEGGSAEATVQLGKAYNKLGREADADKALNRAIRDNPRLRRLRRLERTRSIFFVGFG
jgi:hypothetical protein